LKEREENKLKHEEKITIKSV